MLADNANNNANFDWNLASGAVLNLNGAGKATDSPQSVINPEGALRITLAQITSTSFNNPVVLQSDSVISVPVAGLTATLTKPFPDLAASPKHGDGTLILSNANNSYSGDTTLLAGGPLSITSPFLSDTADVYLTTGSVFNLNFSGTDTIRSLFVDGVAQAVGTYGAADLGGLLITGSGLLASYDVATGRFAGRLQREWYCRCRRLRPVAQMAGTNAAQRTKASARMLARKITISGGADLAIAAIGAALAPVRPAVPEPNLASNAPSLACFSRDVRSPSA